MKLILTVQNWLILSSLALILNGCASIKPITGATKPLERVSLELARPLPLELDVPVWIIITPSNVTEVWSKLEKQNKDLALFSLTDKDYQILAIELVKIRNKLSEYRLLLQEYRLYYEPNSETTKEIKEVVIEEDKTDAEPKEKPKKSKFHLPFINDMEK